MPTSVPAFSYSCDVCGTIYTHPTQDVAQTMAEECEGLGRPVYMYEIGRQFITQFFWTGKQTVVIIDRRIRLDSGANGLLHFAEYQIGVTIDGEMSTRWLTQLEVTRELDARYND